VQDLIPGGLAGLEAFAWRIFYGSMLCFALELLFPTGAASIAARARAALFWSIYIAITVSFFTIFNRLWSELNVHPLFDLRFAASSGSRVSLFELGRGAVIVLAVAMVGDWFYYWFHRLQHTSRLLWRFHEVHHSIKDLSAWNSNHNFTELIFRLPLIALPMNLLVHVGTGPVPSMVYVLLGMQGQFEHSATRLHFGFLRYLFADNRFHRIHHSIEAQHRDRNFGAMTSIWDSLFGTAYFPRHDEWPDVGVSGIDPPVRVSDYLLRPFEGLARCVGALNPLRRARSYRWRVGVRTDSHQRAALENIGYSRQKMTLPQDPATASERLQ
jgi:sterol desaturase/sphingolipid hydroxylase (fatty acid hydroxylase superfamily)